MAYLVVGESVAGIAAALELAGAGDTVHLVLHQGDNTGLEDSFLIGPTPLNEVPLRGTRFAELAFAALEKVGVQTRRTDSWFGSWDRVLQSPGTGELLFEEHLEATPQRFRGAVFAPSGSEPGLSRELEGPFLGRGLSYSAWSDAPYFRGRPVAVVGCGAHAFEQALLAAEYAGFVTLFCEDPSLAPPGCLEGELQRTANLILRTNNRIRSLLPDFEGKLAGILVDEDGVEWVFPAHALFVAHDPVVGWWAWGSREEAFHLQRRGRLVLAGIAAGAPYEDHAALYESGVRAARQLLEITGGRRTGDA